MTDPGPEPTLAELLDALITAGHEFEIAQQMTETKAANRRLMDIRAAILTRFGGDGERVCVSREDLELLFEMGDWTMQHVDYDGYVRVCKVLSKTPNDPPGRTALTATYAADQQEGE